MNKFKEIANSIVERLTKILKIDVRFYTKSISWLSISQLTGVIRGIATTFLMARLLDPVSFGQFRYSLALFGIAGIFSLSGLNSSLIKGVAKGDTAIIPRIIKILARFTPLGSALLLVTSIERFIHNDPTIAIALFFISIFFVPYTMSGLYGPILTGQERIKTLAKIGIVNNLLFAFFFTIIIFFKKDLITMTVAYFGLDVLIRGMITIYVVKKTAIKGSSEEYLKIGQHMSGITIMQSIAMNINQVLLQRFWGYQTLASFSIATIIPEQIKNTINSLGGTLLQRISRYKKTENHLAEMQKHFLKGLIASVLVIIAYAATAPVIFPWLFPQYTNEILPSIIYAIGLIGMPALIGIYFLQAHNEIEKLWKYYSLNTFLQIFSSILLTPLFGAWGSIWSRVITRVGSLPLSYPSYKRHSDQETRER